jgi:tRNA A37 threonylcarbamoyladenosine synthetase subunit TsaC/SUA5/YrdC
MIRLIDISGSMPVSPSYHVKGNIPETEIFDVFAPEVKMDDMIAEFKKATDLIEKVEKKKGCLDSLVHELKVEEASAINKGGVSSQLGYLVETLGNKEAIKRIEELV